MNSSNNTEADPGLLPTSSTHPGSKPEPMSNDELSDSDVSFDEEDEDDELMHDTSGKYLLSNHSVHRGLRGYEMSYAQMSLFEHKLWDFCIEMAIFRNLPKNFSMVLIDDSMCKMAAQACRF